MTVEADLYWFKNKDWQTSGPTGTESINSGAYKKIRYLNPVEFGVFNTNDTRCVIDPENPNKKTIGMKFKDEVDDDGYVKLEGGVRLDLTRPIEMQRGDRVVLRKKAKKTTREIHLYFEDSEYDNSEVLDPDTRVPVLV